MKNLFSISIYFILLFFNSILYSQTPEDRNFTFDENECYIIARGTKSKREFIGRKFNIQNDSITHIGIGITINKVFKIFNVNAVRNINALSIDDFATYKNQPDLTYLGIWMLELNDKEKNDLKNNLAEFERKYIHFDFDFLIDNEEKKLYCSEFCWLITNNLGSEYKYEPRNINIINLGLNSILKRDVLTYIPTDYFLVLPNLEFITSWNINL